jgi:hypothetical protein
MMLLVGTSTVFPSLVFIQETFGSDTIICPIKVLPSSNRLDGGWQTSRMCLLPGGRDLRRCRGNDPRSDDFVSTTRRANQCASALADFAQDRRLTSTRRTLANILGRSVPYFDDLPHVVARPSVPSFASSILLPEFLGIMARNVHVFPSPHGKLHTFSKTIDLSVFAPRSFAYYRACSLTL